METRGNIQAFFDDVLPDRFVPEIHELVVAAWHRMRTPKPNELEQRITALLRDSCIAEYEDRYRGRDFPFHVSHENKRTDPITGVEVVRTDLEVYVRRLNIRGQKPYFVFESKRLNIPYSVRVRSNAGEYVGRDGMMCFVSGRYENGPSFCGMIGYVMNGDVASAQRSVEGAVRRTRRRLRLRAPHCLAPSSLLPTDHRHRETHHAGKSRGFTIYHIFLAC